jgi:hypothetical protein
MTSAASRMLAVVLTAVGLTVIYPDVGRVLPGRDRARDVGIGDDADQLAGLRLRDDQGGRIRALHQVGSRSHVVVRFNRRDRWLHDVRDRSRAQR